MKQPDIASNPLPYRRPPLDIGALLLNGYVWLVLLVILVPLAIILSMSFGTDDYLVFPPRGFTWHWYVEYFSDRRWRNATTLSLSVAALTAIAVSILGTMATYAMVRGRATLRSAFQLLVLGPIIVPHIALAAGLYLLFQKWGLNGTMLGFVLAHTVLAMPFFVFTVAAALIRVNPDLESAAMTCGASRLQAFLQVTLPLIWPNVLTGALFAFIISFDEPVVSFFLSGIRERTLPRKLFENIEQNLTPIIPAIAVLLTLISVAALVAAYFLSTMSKRKAAAARTP